VISNGCGGTAPSFGTGIVYPKSLSKISIPNLYSLVEVAAVAFPYNS
jgi:hypothetical protein